jgi:lipopolysaccharide/colanic/teichoic acid biosynthesis glycosyltransferase
MFRREKVNLIILGEQHSYTSLELNLLEKNFRTIEFIKYKDIVVEEVITKIKFFIKNNKKVFIVLNTKAIVPKKLLDFLSKREYPDVAYFSVESFMEKYLKKCYISDELIDIDFLENFNPFSRQESFLKVLIDYTLAISILVITMPIVLYTIFKIKKESPGAIFFKQDRVGLNRKVFSCYKFRSMHENSHHDPYTRENDSRIFPWGNIMRKTRIDEIPQLINVLKGDMHLIGPRAEWNILVDDYEKVIPYYHERHIIKPGITGWAQVNYPYGVNSEDSKQKLMYDLYYIKHWSLWLEVQTVWKTVMVVLGKKGI